MYVCITKIELMAWFFMRLSFHVHHLVSRVLGLPFHKFKLGAALPRQQGGATRITFARTSFLTRHCS